jgi:lysophospholipase L1-like esterase
MSANSDRMPPPPKPFWKRLLQNLLLSGVVFLMCCAALETTLRVMGYGNLEIYQPDAKLYWRLQPNQDCYTKVDHKPVHINAHGSRGPEFSDEKPAGTIRILSLGDSRTFGWGLTDEETYSRRVQNLAQTYVGDGRKVEVINAGVNAWSYPQMLVYFREYGLRYHPDYVVLADANLWTQFSEKSSPEFVRQFLRRVWLKNFLRRFALYHYFIEVKLKAFYEQHRAKFIPVDPQQDTLFKEQQQNDPEALFRGAIEGVCALAQSNNVKPVLVFLPMLDNLNPTNRVGVLEVKRAAAKKYAVPLVDPTADLRPGGKELYLDADPVHFNAQGNRIIAERIFETLTNNIGR